MGAKILPTGRSCDRSDGRCARSKAGPTRKESRWPWHCSTHAWSACPPSVVARCRGHYRQTTCVRGGGAGNSLALIDADPLRFIEIITRTARPPGVVARWQPGQAHPRLNNRLMWDDDPEALFCGSISVRWQPGTAARATFMCWAMSVSSGGAVEASRLRHAGTGADAAGNSRGSIAILTSRPTPTICRRSVSSWPMAASLSKLSPSRWRFGQPCRSFIDRRARPQQPDRQRREVLVMHR